RGRPAHTTSRHIANSRHMGREGAEMIRMRDPILRALVLALGLASAGWLAGQGFARGRMTDRFVTVKGLSERPVKANLALWPLRIVATDNDLGRAQTKT